MKYTLALNELEIYAYHGYYAIENKIGGRYLVSLAMDICLLDAEEITDNLNDIINYEQVYQVIQEQMAIPAKLIEHVGFRIFDQALKLARPKLHIEGMRLKLEKLNPPFPCQTKSASVCLRYPPI